MGRVHRRSDHCRPVGTLVRRLRVLYGLDILLLGIRPMSFCSRDLVCHDGLLLLVVVVVCDSSTTVDWQRYTMHDAHTEGGREMEESRKRVSGSRKREGLGGLPYVLMSI